MDNLDTLVSRYGKTDAEIKALKKENDADKERIKTIMGDLGEDDWTAGGYTVKKVVSTTETMNEESLLSLMQQNKTLAELHGILKTKEYVDTDALESAIYSGKIPTEILQEMSKCKETKTVVSLRCTKAKEA